MTSGVVSPQRANPSLQCNHTFAGSLAAALCGTQPHCDGRFAGPSLTVRVEWGSLTEAEPGPFTLTARYEGEQLLQEHVDASHQELMLSLSIARFTYGSTIHCELCWPGGARHLHVMRPLEPSCLAFGGLVSVIPSAADIAAAELSPSMVANIRTMPASCWWRSISTATLEVETLCAPVRPLRLSSVERGLVSRSSWLHLLDQAGQAGSHSSIRASAPHSTPLLSDASRRRQMPWPYFADACAGLWVTISQSGQRWRTPHRGLWKRVPSLRMTRRKP